MDPAVAEYATIQDQARRRAVQSDRQSRWGDLIPEGVTGKMRDDLTSELDLAHFAMNWPVNKFALQWIELSAEVRSLSSLVFGC